jgi:hypothetical protein
VRQSTRAVKASLSPAITCTWIVSCHSEDEAFMSTSRHSTRHDPAIVIAVALLAAVTWAALLMLSVHAR